MNNLIPLMVIIPLLCALVVNIFSSQNKFVKGLSFIVALIIPSIAILANYGLHFFGGYTPMLDNVTGLIFHPAITYSFDIISKIFIFLVGLLGFLVVFIYISNNKKVSGQYLFLIFLGIAAITAIVLTDDIFNLYVAFEILVISQVGIIAASTIEDNYEMALKYMIIGSIGGPLLLLGISFLIGLFGTVNITDMVVFIQSGLVDPTSPPFLMACALIFFGWLYVSGLPPFHTIKSGLYSKAEPHGAAIVQAFSVIAMISIALVMCRLFMGIKYFEPLIVAFSVMAMILGIVMALTQNDFRRMIGFLAVGELGFIGLGIGLGTTFAITAGIFQAINEMLITALLFIGFGAVARAAGETDLRKLGGLIAYYPKTAILILLGGLAMAGVPPLNGFQSKLMLVQASISCGYPELSLLTIIVSIATFIVFVKTFYMIFLRPKPKDLEVKSKLIPNSIIFALVVLLIICVILGLFPNIVTHDISMFVGGLFR